MEKKHKQSYEAPSIEIHAVNQPLDVLVGFSGTATIDPPEIPDEEWGDYTGGYKHPLYVPGDLM